MVYAYNTSGAGWMDVDLAITEFAERFETLIQTGKYLFGYIARLNLIDKNQVLESQDRSG